MKKKLGRFEIEKELGSGGMGIVYLANDPKIDRKIALKIVRKSTDRSNSDIETIDRFYIEAKAAGKLNHPNIVTIYDIGETLESDAQTVYIAMELVDGKGLDWYIYNHRFKNIKEKVEIIKAIASGLDYAHRKGVIHRDIKPANILITDEGKIPKITDFGLARLANSSLTVSGTILGTPSYMSPEQIISGSVDERSDIFSLSILFYELLTKERPFTGESITSIIYSVVHKDPKSIKSFSKSFPDELALFVKKGLSKDPNERYQNCTEFIKGLNSLPELEEDYAYLAYNQDDLTVPAANDPYSSLVTQFKTEARKRHIYLIIAGAIVALLLFAGLGLLIFSDKNIPKDRKEFLLKYEKNTKQAK